VRVGCLGRVLCCLGGEEAGWGGFRGVVAVRARVRRVGPGSGACVGWPGCGGRVGGGETLRVGGVRGP